MCREIGLAVSKMPPCEDAFKQLIAIWQTKIWVLSSIAMPNYGNPEEFGWKRESGVLCPVHYEGVQCI